MGCQGARKKELESAQYMRILVLSLQMQWAKRLYHGSCRFFRDHQEVEVEARELGSAEPNELDTEEFRVMAATSPLVTLQLILV